MERQSNTCGFRLISMGKPQSADDYWDGEDRWAVKLKEPDPGPALSVLHRRRRESNCNTSRPAMLDANPTPLERKYDVFHEPFLICTA
jgi:hypothetical protein